MGRTGLGRSYFEEGDQGDPEDHAGVDATRQTVKYGAHGVDHAPQGEDYKATHGHDAVQLGASVIVLQHTQIENSQDGDAVDGKVRAGQEETNNGCDDDGDEAGGLFLEGHDGVGGGHGVVEQRNRHDQVQTPPDLRPRRILWFKIFVHYI